eukprot:c15896_g1_i1.p1 GENE.c15896_g1_i1~~c15896_g1_i1.p1  ORF type:complete len:176 (+),score=19.29 c15896_g1_i1:43-570(+)
MPAVTPTKRSVLTPPCRPRPLKLSPSKTDLSLMAKPVRVVVGGSVFLTSVATLTHRESGSSLSQASLSWNWKENPVCELVYDRSPRLFLAVLNYLRTGKLPLISEADLPHLLAEAMFYNCVGLTRLVQTAINRKKAPPRPEPMASPKPKQIHDESDHVAASPKRDEDLIFHMADV